MDGSLQSLLQSTFGTGLLELKRVTYDNTSGAVLEKIAAYESVHRIASLDDLKHRLGHKRYI